MTNLDFTLTEEMARVFVQDNELELEGVDKGRSFRVINVEGFNNMTSSAAEILSKFDGQLNLQNLTNLSDAAAEHLSNYQGEYIWLDSLVELSDDAAENLSKSKAEKIFLRGLTEISDAAAESFSKYVGDLILNSPDNKEWVVKDEQCVKLSNAAIESLSKKHSGTISWENPNDWADLMRDYDVIDKEAAEKFLKNPENVRIFDATEISTEAAESLSNYEGGDLYLNGLTELSDDAAESLSRFQGVLGLNRLTELSDAAAESFSKFQGRLELNRLTELSDAAARSLSKIKVSEEQEGLRFGDEAVLEIEGVTKLSDAAAESFSEFRGEILHLGLTELSDAAAESLSKCQVNQLFILRLTELSDAAAESFSKSKGIGWLHLSGITKPSRAVRKSLSKYKGEICFTNSRAQCGFCKDTHKPAGYMTSHDRVIRWSEYKKEDEWYKKIFSSS